MSGRDPFLGQIVGGRYRVTRLIGRGGMGAIYEVAHLKLGRAFALKKLVAALAGDAEALARFQREADVIARMRHPNIVEVTDWETADDGSPCIIMELLRGEALGDRLERGGPFAWADVARLADPVLSALAVAHRAGVVHRDLKPHNIFITVDDAGEEHVKLLDFGVSKIRHAKTRLTADDRLVGTPAYMAPEQADGRVDDIGPQTDVWAMGAILFEMATGRDAFTGPSTPSLLYQICHGEPASLREARPDAPRAFVEVVGAALSRDPKRRIVDIDVLRARLRLALVEVGVAPPTVSRSLPIPDDAEERPTRPMTTLSAATGQRTVPPAGTRSRSRALALAGGLAACGALALGGWLALSHRAAATNAAAVNARATNAATMNAPAASAPAMNAPTMNAPAASAPTMNAPTTSAPTTSAPTTSAPTMNAPATRAPSMNAPATRAPTMYAPVTNAQATRATTMNAPATSAPAMNAPAASAPPTINAQATHAPTINAQATRATTMSAPATSAPTMNAPSTRAPTIDAPATSAPTMNAPSTNAPSMNAPAASAPRMNQPAAKRGTIAIALERSPRGARVTIDGAEAHGDVVVLPDDGREHRLRVSAPGYAADERMLDASAPRALAIALERLTPARRPVARPKAATAARPTPAPAVTPSATRAAPPPPAPSPPARKDAARPLDP